MEENSTPRNSEDAPAQLSFFGRSIPLDFSGGIPGRNQATVSEREFHALLELDPAGVPWAANYLRLRKSGWPFEEAVIICWAATEREMRLYKTQDDLSKGVLGGLSRQMIGKRLRRPAVKAEIEKVKTDAWAPHMHRIVNEVIPAAVAVAAVPDPKHHQDRKMVLEATGLVGKGADSQTVQIINAIFDKIDMSKLSEEQLERLERGENPLLVLADPG